MTENLTSIPQLENSLGQQLPLLGHGLYDRFWYLSRHCINNIVEFFIYPRQRGRSCLRPCQTKRRLLARDNAYVGHYLHRMELA